MEPNVGGVTHMTVINPGRPQRNPFQWIRGGGRHGAQRLSPTYKTIVGSRGWAKRHDSESKGARLAAVDEYGTILTRPLSRKQVLKNGRSSTMAYNLTALKRAMRKNMSSADRRAIKAAARGIDAAPRSKKRRASRTKVSGGKVTATRRSRSSKRRSAPKTSKHTSKKTATAKGATAAAKSASKQAKVAKKASTRAKRATSKKAASSAAKVAKKASTRAKKAAKKATSRATKAKPSSKRAANRAAAKARSDAAKAEAAANAAATAVRRASSRASRRGRISRQQGSFHSTTKARSSYRKVKGFSASPYRTGRLFNPPYVHITSKHPKRRSAGLRMAANVLGRVSQRSGVPTGQRVQMVEFGPRSKRKGYAVYVPGYVSERAYVRKFKFGGAAKRAHQRALQTGYSRKRYSKKTRAVSANSRRTSMRRNSKKRHSRKSSKRRRSSKRRSSRRVSANRYFVMKNGRRRRRLRRNMSVFGIDPVTQIAIPGAYAVSGLMVANVLSNYAAAMPSITGVLDAGRADPIVTKSLAGAVGAGLTIAFGGKLPSVLRDHLTPIVAGMGCAVAVRLLRGTNAAPYLGSWGAGFGEYVDQPLGEYVNQPLGAYVQDPSMGEYVDQPLGEYVDQPLGGLGTMYAAAGYPEGIDPADQGSVDGLMDVMEAAAGVGAYEAAAGMGTMYAAAGMGTLYAAAGMGQEEGGTPGVVGSPIPIPTFTPPVGPNGFQQPPFISTETPIDPARRVNATMFRDLPVKTSIVTSEGRGSAGGIFSRSIFGGMM